MHASFAFALSLAVTAVASPTALFARGADDCLTVGSDGQYDTIQKAVNNLDQETTTPQCIEIYTGTYEEQVTIPKLGSPLSIYGQTKDGLDYASNTVNIQQKKSQAQGYNNDGTATIRAHTPNLSLYNLNIINTYGPNSQAVALSATRDKQAYYACQIIGFQDTLLAQDGRLLFSKCYIEGSTDFIFGDLAAAWFDDCTIGVRETKNGVGYITASGRGNKQSKDGSDTAIYVINNAHVDAAPDNKVAPGTYYLGRPWGKKARVVFQFCSLSNVINPAGWSAWSKGENIPSTVEFSEYQNKGVGARRVDNRYERKAPVSIKEVLGSEYTEWVDDKFLG